MAQRSSKAHPPDLASLAARVEDLERVVHRVAETIIKKADGRPRRPAQGPQRRYSVQQNSIRPGFKPSEPQVFDSVLAVAEHTGYSPGTVSVRLSQHGGTWHTATKPGGVFYTIKRL